MAHRSYQHGSIRDLLRAVRNCDHLQGMPPEVQRLLLPRWLLPRWLRLFLHLDGGRLQPRAHRPHTRVARLGDVRRVEAAARPVRRGRHAARPRVHEHIAAAEADGSALWLVDQIKRRFP